ncbi:MAG: T9SS type A sorting domain-containing protein [Saprospiraceae bacterium]|nr:T9SS type A sorting domain-containing protein [Saprospiraceae bacterium]
MRYIQFIMAFALLFVLGGTASAHLPEREIGKKYTVKPVQYRDVCANSLAQIDQSINNVRARLLAGGDIWWDLNDGKYIVPKVDPATGQREVSALFAGAVWLGGRDPGGSLKLACQNYRNDGLNDCWTGPLREDGTTDRAQCDQWDRHFRVTGDEIRQSLRAKTVAELPRNIRGWPAKGNPYFVDVWGFDLPFTKQGLASFYDNDNDCLFDPLKGDYPSIDIRHCPLNQYPDEMIFWIYNDQGGGASHANTKGDAIQMEIQVQAFGYVTNDELNDMTFQRYKLINRATEYIDSTYFAMWADPDLGCYLDDYIGCDTTRDLMFVYNQDAVDGQPGASCDQGVTTYGAKVPILGIDYFRGPLRQILDSTGTEVLDEVEIGMSSFTYHNGTNAPPGTEDPGGDDEYYNLLKGLWRDGEAVTEGGSGRGGSTPTKYVFPDQPGDENGWSMCQVNPPYADRRTLQASGPFRLNPGAVNELIIGVPWVPDIPHPCPDVEAIFRADELAQGLFDNCFDLLDGPDAPFVNWIELNREVVAVLGYPDSTGTNNWNESYQENDIFAPEDISIDAKKYRFEGYKIYQLIDPNVSAKDFETNTDKSRLVAQVDLKNNVTKLYNWEDVEQPFSNEPYPVPVLKTNEVNQGVRRTFSLTEDLFSTANDKKLINHKKYYYVAIAYAFNNYSDFKPASDSTVESGQPNPYLVGRKAGYGEGAITTFTVIPRPVVDVSLKASYGDGPQITRLQGVGNQGNFLDITDESRNALIKGNPVVEGDTAIVYKEGKGPFTVTIFNPFEVKDGSYELRFVDDNNSDNVLRDTARWELALPNGTIIASAKTIAAINEQVIADYGFSVQVAQPEEPGQLQKGNGAIGAEVAYSDPDRAWLVGLPDGEYPFNFVKTGSAVEEDAYLDPRSNLSTMGDGWFVPYALADWRTKEAANELTDPTTRMITPGWMNATNGVALGNEASRRTLLGKLPNVDIVLTSDTSLWSRCIVVETANAYYTNAIFPKGTLPDGSALSPESPTGKVRAMFDTRFALSVGKTDADGDGRPDPDGAINPSVTGIPAAYQGQPMYGTGWFPGYAIDVETGARLNIFFGENSCYKSNLFPEFNAPGNDMLFNPNNLFFDNRIEPFLPNFGGTAEYYNYVLGGQHMVYVMSTPYDGCEAIRRRFTPEFAANPPAFKASQIKNIAWAGMLATAPGYQMKSLREGLIPNDATIKLRVNNKFQTWYDEQAGPNKRSNPRYRFNITGRQAVTDLTSAEKENALDSVKVVPNPYYGFSDYETSSFSNTVKITNLPGECTVTIYSLDGKFIRQYTRNEKYQYYNQISPAIEWDLKNSKAIPVASGVYLINVQSPLGERTIKWFGVARQFDPTGL